MATKGGVDLHDRRPVPRWVTVANLVVLLAGFLALVPAVRPHAARGPTRAAALAAPPSSTVIRAEHLTEVAPVPTSAVATTTTTVRPGPAASDPALVTAAVAAPEATPTLRPVDIPLDSYAPEPVHRIGSLEIPRIGLVQPLYEGITLHNIDLGPSLWPGTAMPGEVGNTVIAGHRSTRTHPFLHIDRMKPGDQVIFTVAGQRSVYAMTSAEVVEPTALWIADQTATATATLFSCHPIHSAAQRYVVHLALLPST